MVKDRSRIAALVAACVVLALALLPAGQALAQTSARSAATKALTWVKTQQQTDGSFAGFGAGSTVDALLAILAVGENPAAYSKGGNTAATFLESKAAEIGKTPGGAGKLLVAVGALERGGGAFAGKQALVDAVNAGYDAATGRFGQDVLSSAFSALGLRAARASVPSKAIDFLTGAQLSSGGWSFTGETGENAADTNTTAVVVQALLASGRSKAGDPALERAATYLEGQRNDDGGYPYQQGGQYGSESDVNSTAYVVQALTALGKTDAAARGTAFLLSAQNPTGAFFYQKSQPDDNAGATYQAIPALLGATLAEPLPAVGTTAGGEVVTGMPRTGSPADFALPLALCALLLTAGVAMRRRVVATN